MKKIASLSIAITIFVFLLAMEFPKPSYAQTCTADNSGQLSDNSCLSGTSPQVDCGTGFCTCTCVQTGQNNSGGGSNNLDNTCKGGSGIDTAIGCIPVKNPTETAGFFLSWGVGIGGGIAFLIFVFSGFQIMTAQGDPQKLQKGKEMLTSAVAGLILLIFAVFILRVVGVDILKIPGLTG